MNLAAVIGMTLTILVFLSGASKEFHDLSAIIEIWDLPAIIIIFGGTIASTFLGFPLAVVLKAPKAIGRVFIPNKVNLIETLVIIVDMAKIARKNVMAIEDSLPSIENDYLQSGLRLIVDRVDRETIYDILASEIKYKDQVKVVEVNIFKSAAVLAPAYGMIGTLLGLISMLRNLNDPSSVGPAMSMALIATTYGALLSNAVCFPMASFLDICRKNELVESEMIRDGVLLIEKNERAEFIEQQLMNYLTPDLKSDYEKLKFQHQKEVKK